MLKEKINLNIPGRNVSSLPSLKKVVINYRVDDARESAESLAAAEKELVAISGQKPRLCRAKKSIAAFKLRQGDPLAFKVTLRGDRMDDFVEKFINIVLPRLRDFKGMPLNAFDDAGNYNLTIKDQTYFPEIDLNKVNKIRSVQITISIATKSKDEARMLLSAHGFPFEKQ